MQKHLKPRQEYIDQYDMYTVDICRRLEKLSEETDISEEGEKITRGQSGSIKKVAKNLMLYFQKGERYLNKEKIVNEWMKIDQQKDELYESAQPPEGIRCLTCRNKVLPTIKELWYGRDDDSDRVLFMFDCPNKCLPRRAFFSDGQEYRTKPDLCSNCGSALKLESNTDDKVKSVTIYSCSQCGNKKVEEYTWVKKQDDEIDVHFATDRDRFCLSDEEGKKYQGEKWNLEQVGKFMEEWKEKEKLREEKLKKNPEGFHLEGQGYTCFICGDSTPEGDNWYDQYGIKCLVCQKAIDNGEVPASLASDKDSWYTKYDIERSFNVKGPTLRKWIRQGIIKPRIVSHYGQGVHCEVFIIEDNKDFLPPKNLVESKWGNVKNGDKVESRHVPWYQLSDPKEQLKGYKILDYLKIVNLEENKDNTP